MFQITVYVPPDHCETLKTAMFAAGGGTLGPYEHCCWQSLGTGQFRPLPGSNPAQGEIGHLFRQAEMRIDMVCQDDAIKAVIVAMKKAHPYETPAYSVVRLVDI